MDRERTERGQRVEPGVKKAQWSEWSAGLIFSEDKAKWPSAGKDEMSFIDTLDIAHRKSALSHRQAEIIAES